MVKWYYVCKVTCYYAITLADESASALYRGEVVSWRRGSMTPR